jgi:hypothetical protein
VRFADLLGDEPEPERERENAEPAPTSPSTSPPATAPTPAPSDRFADAPEGEREPLEPPDFEERSVPWELEPLEPAGPDDEPPVAPQAAPEQMADPPPMRPAPSPFSEFRHPEPGGEADATPAEPEPAEVADLAPIDDTFLPSRRHRGK